MIVRRHHGRGDRLTVDLVYKRSKISADVHVRPTVLARHRAFAAALGCADMNAYFSELLAGEPLESAFDFVVLPYFGPYTKVEFAQELIAAVLPGTWAPPWGNDPVDMEEGAFRNCLDRWGLTLPSCNVDIASVLATAASAALDGDGARVREALAPHIDALSPRKDEETEEEVTGP